MKYTTDVWFASFLLSKQIKLERYEVVDRNKVRCFFNLTDDDWKKLKVEFNNSEIIKFKGYIDQIKDLLY